MMTDNEESSGSYSCFSCSNTSEPRQASSADRYESETGSSDMANIDGAVLEENNRGGTRAGQVVDSIDAGIEEPLDASVVLNATEYFQEFDNLEHETARLCNIHKVIASSSDISLTDCLIILWGCRDALHNLERAEFCSTYFNIFVEDPQRNVANAVTISIFEIDNLIAALQFQTRIVGMLTDLFSD